MGFKESTAAAKIIAIIFLGGIIATPRNTVRGEIRCPLVWKDFKLTDSPLPEDLVPAFPYDEYNFIIRRKADGDRYRIGRFRVHDNVYLIGTNPDDPVESSHQNLSILQNVHGCTIRWSKTPIQEFLVRADAANKGDVNVVGSIVTGSEPLAGEANFGTKKLQYVNSDRKADMAEEHKFVYLISVSDGLHLEFTNLSFADPFQGSVEFLGIDEIVNHGPGLISQAVTQTKDILRTTEFYHDRNWEHCAQVTFNFEINLTQDVGTITLKALGQNIYQSFGEDKLKVKGILGSEVEETLTTTRQIEVNGYARVQACTLIGRMDKFNNKFNATGKYTARGWTGEEVLEYLKTRINDSAYQQNLVSINDYVESFESGTFSGETYLNNVMVVLDPTYDKSCVELEELFYRLRGIQTEGRRTGRTLKELEQGIESRIADILRR